MQHNKSMLAYNNLQSSVDQIQNYTHDASKSPATNNVKKSIASNKMAKLDKSDLDHLSRK